MKKFFSALWYGFRKFLNYHKYLLKFIAVLYTCTILAFFFCSMSFSKDLPNEEKYEDYETIVKQAWEMNGEDIRKIELPENTKIERKEPNKIVVSNKISHYSVTGEFAQNKLNITSDSGAAECATTVCVSMFAFSGIGFIIFDYVDSKHQQIKK